MWYSFITNNVSILLPFAHIAFLLQDFFFFFFLTFCEAISLVFGIRAHVTTFLFSPLCQARVSWHRLEPPVEGRLRKRLISSPLSTVVLTLINRKPGKADPSITASPRTRRGPRESLNIYLTSSASRNHSRSSRRVDVCSENRELWKWK